MVFHIHAIFVTRTDMSILKLKNSSLQGYILDMYFFTFALKHRLRAFVALTSTHNLCFREKIRLISNEAGPKSTHKLCFRAKIKQTKKHLTFSSENCHVTAIKICSITETSPYKSDSRFPPNI